ncbi:MAG: DNA primase [Planctomycetota bacterium]
MDNSLKERVLEAVDIVEVIGERVSLTRKGKEFVGLCPFHPDHNPSLNVNPLKRLFKCWACGAGGDVIGFVQKMDRIEFPEALRQLAQRAGLPLSSDPGERRAAALRAELHSVVSWAREHFRSNLRDTPGGRQAREYALGRGLTPETIDRCGLGFAANAWDHVVSAARRRNIRPELLNQAGLAATSEAGHVYDRFRNRLIFPIADSLGRPIAFGGRTLGDDPAKYLNSPETPLFSKARVLYGLDRAREAIRQRNAAIVVEGYMDCVLLAQHGFEHAVATLGTALTDAHVKLLRPLAQRLYLCFDSDLAGVKAAERALEVALRTQMDVRVVVLAGDKDPADCVVRGGAGAFEAQLTGARDALEFKWSQALSGYGPGDPRGRRAAIEELVRFVAGAAVAGGVDPLDQDLIVSRLSDLLGVSSHEVFELLTRAKRQMRTQAAGGPPPSAAASDYEAALRGLPAGVIIAAETLLGLLATASRHWRWVDNTVARGVELSETWRRLYEVLLEVHQDVGEYSLREVVARCEDSALCEALSRVRQRVGGLPAGAEAFLAARQRLAFELNVLAHMDLCADVRSRAQERGGDDTAAFARLRQIARSGRAASLSRAEVERLSRDAEPASAALLSPGRHRSAAPAPRSAGPERKTDDQYPAP